MLRNAGEAIQALTLQADGGTITDTTIEQRRANFSKATSGYFSALSYVDVHLRREIYALEEANIIPADIPKETGALSNGVKAGTASMGNLDIGWLNSRNDKVGTDMRAELWSQAKDILEVVNLDEMFKGTALKNGALPD